MAACRMVNVTNAHTPVLLAEAVDHLVHTPDGIYVDATFGRGSHSQAILDRLSKNAKLIAFDKDPEAIAYAHAHFGKDPRFSIIHSSFAAMAECLQQLDLIGKINGILFDLGVSSPQLDTAARGFSFMRDGILDMRMDTTQGIDAKTWLQTVDETTLANVIWQYGEERFSRRIAKAIVTARAEAPITTTFTLAALVKRAIPKPKKPQDKHPATRTFQAIRIFINAELEELQTALAQTLDVLAIGGRLSVISFHSLEDRLVKQFMRTHEQGVMLPRGLPIKESTQATRLKTIGKAIKPSLQETSINPRARSAMLRIAEKRS